MSYQSTSQPGPAVVSRPNNTLAIISLVLGIVGIVGLPTCCCSGLITSAWFLLLGIPAAITGYMARKQIAESGGQQGGEQLAMAGMIMGIVEVVLAILFGIVLVMLMIAGVALPTLTTLIPTPSY